MRRAERLDRRIDPRRIAGAAVLVCWRAQTSRRSRDQTPHPHRSNSHRAGSWPRSRGLPADGAAMSQGGLRRHQLASDQADARHGPGDAAGRRHLPRSVLRHQPARRRTAGPVSTGLVVPHHVRRARPGTRTYTLQFPGINYRAEIWLNGQLIADSDQIVGMYTAHELDVTPWINRGAAEHAGRQGDSGAGPAGHRRGRTRRQLVGLDQLARYRLPGHPARTRSAARPSCPTATPASGNRSTSRCPATCRSDRPPSTPNFPCPEQIPRG